MDWRHRNDVCQSFSLINSKYTAFVWTMVCIFVCREEGRGGTHWCPAVSLHQADDITWYQDRATGVFFFCFSEKNRNFTKTENNWKTFNLFSKSGLTGYVFCLLILFVTPFFINMEQVPLQFVHLVFYHLGHFNQEIGLERDKLVLNPKTVIYHWHEVQNK